jgi:diadenosine tetraphosphate (Ap4A) HIT family hydrolase
VTLVDVALVDVSLADLPFSSRDALHQRFVAGLDAMLDRHDGLGVYILVLANAAQDPALWQPLREKLMVRHLHHAATIKAALRHGAKLDAPEDDLMVFLKLMAMGLGPDEFEQLQVSARRQLGSWEVQFNPLRALRPARMSTARVEGIMRPFDASSFHFNKPFLAKEVLWQGELAGKPARLLYNKFPFAPLHGLLVPVPELQRPQFLSPELHGWAWEVAKQAGVAIPGFGIAYNSYGAYASVNHLHFQTFAREQPLPLQCLDLSAYPLAAQRFDDPQSAWFQLDALHQQGTPYNLIYDVGGVIVIARARQGDVPLQTWSPGFAWSEMAGAFSVGSREEYDGLSEAEITQALQALRV